MMPYRSAPGTFTVTPRKRGQGRGPEDGEKRPPSWGSHGALLTGKGSKTLTVNIQIATGPGPGSAKILRAGRKAI